MKVTLREVVDSDFSLFFTHQLDREANWMAAFTVADPGDREAYLARQARFRQDASIIMRTILGDGEVVGSIVLYGEPEFREVSYWVDKPHWGQGVATKALLLFLDVLSERPIYARVAKDNLGSMRVLEKGGFVITMADKGYANARGKEIEEWVMKLDVGGKGDLGG